MVKLENISYRYEKNWVVKDLDHIFESNKTIGLFGKNGAGKTTLFRLLASQLFVNKGSILYKDKPLDGKYISFLPTDPFFYPYMKGKEYLDLLSKNNFNYQKWADTFSLPLDKFVDDYSTGMKKKLAFIGVVALDMDVIILDEPFSGVDLEGNEKMKYVIKELQKQGKMILISSHILSTLTEICDEIHFFSHGKIDTSYSPETYPVLIELINDSFENEMEELFD